jgi:hypothetical protein
MQDDTLKFAQPTQAYLAFASSPGKPWPFPSGLPQDLVDIPLCFVAAYEDGISGGLWPG